MRLKKIAIVHDQLQEFGGAERVLVTLKKIFPKAPIYTSTSNINKLGFQKELFKRWKVITSWFGKIPIVNRFYSPFRFLTPLIWEGFDFSSFDLVISSSGSWMSKGIITKKPTIHIAYIHHPPRYLYGYETAIEWQKYLPIKIYGHVVNHFLRLWDFKASQRADFLIANSLETKRRIEKFYRRQATVIYPPVDIPKKPSNLQTFKPSNLYLTVSRLARAKHIDVLIKAANRMNFPLKIVGVGRDEQYLKSLAGKTVQFLGALSDKQLKTVYSQAKAFLFASVDEEFGIAPVEAMGWGLPVIAFRSGGVPEYLKNSVNGYLFDKLDPELVIEKIKTLEKLPLAKLIQMKKSARKTAEKFSQENFRKNIVDFINSCVTRYKLPVTR